MPSNSECARRRNTVEDAAPLRGSARRSQVSRQLASAGPPVVAATVAWCLNQWQPLLSPLLVALIFGAIVANTRGASCRLLLNHAATTKFLLRIGVVMLGLRLPVTDVVAVGWAAIVVILATVVLTYSATVQAGRRLGIDPGLVTLIAAGFSICGAAAIAAVSDAVKARDRDVALAVALVTLFGSAMIGLVPALSMTLHLSQTQAAVWAGASIHEVAQVVAVGSILGSGAIAVATTVKLGRVALLAPTYAYAARSASQSDGSRRVPMLPWFVIGFAATVTLRSTGLIPSSSQDVATEATTILLAAGMFGLGLGLRIADLWPIPLRALLLALVSTIVAAGSSLTLVAILVD